MSLDIKVESLETALEEMKPLLHNHYHEIAWRQDKIKLNPDYDKYKMLEDMGMFLLVTVRSEGELVGYTIYFINDNMHYKDHKYAHNDIVYLDPKYRNAGTGFKLFQIAEEELKKRGCTVTQVQMKTKQPFEELVVALGYEKIEYNYAKYIGES